MPPIRKRKNLSEMVTERIKDLIIDEGLKPGDRLPTEHELAKRFGVSRICVRESTKALGFLGIIRGAPRRGLSVGEVDLHRVTQYLGFHLALGNYPKILLLETRIIIETGALPYTMARMKREPAIQADLSTKAIILGETEDPEARLDRDVAFHRALLEASGIEPLVIFNDLLGIFFKRFRDSLLAGQWKKGEQGHLKIIAALAKGDCERAQKLLRSHIAYHEKNL
jgi:GntR family transcriptional repressor for pyruvate dehydrogenase complex